MKTKTSEKNRGLLFSNVAQALSELIVSVAIAGIVGLGIASLASYGADQFNVLVDQNIAEKNLVQAAYYLRSFMSQAVTTVCAGNAGAYAAVTGIGAPSAVPPIGIRQGQIDCRGSAGKVVWKQSVFNPLAIFNRENGGSPGSVITMPESVFQGVGIYYTPAFQNSSGILTFAVAPANGTITASSASLHFDHLVDVQVLAGTAFENPAVPANPTNVPPIPAVPTTLKTISYVITARYFTTGSAGFLYDLAPALSASSYRDITMQVTVSLHDNFLGLEPTGNNYAERVDGGIYFFKFSSPEFNGL